MKYNISRWLMAVLLLFHFSTADVPKRIPRLIGGAEVQRIGRDWSFIMAVYYDNIYNCIFSLITSETSLGPASCLYNRNISLFHGKVGNVVRERGTIIKFSNYIIHPDYDPLTDDDDIAILTLSTSAEGSLYFVKPVIVPPRNRFMNLWKPVTVAGWGFPDSSMNNDIVVLRKIILPLSQTTENDTDYDTYKTFCVDFEGYDILGKHDLGVPAVRKYGGKLGLYGIKSNKLSSTSAKEMFTSVQYYYDWIKQTLQESFNTKNFRFIV